MGPAAAPQNTSEALGMLQAAAGYLAAVDYPDMPAAAAGEVLLALECADAAAAVARGRALNAFDAKDGHDEDGQRTTGAWLVNIGQVTKAEAAGHRGWGKLVAGHPLIAEVMGEKLGNGTPVMSKSRAKTLCALTGKIPEPHRQQADEILAGVARAGASLRELVFLAAEILARTAPADNDDQDRLTDRSLRLHTTLDGAGVLAGELSPECTAAVQAVLDALSKRCGADDDRTRDQRLHDALHEAMTRLLGSELAPKKNGHPVQAVVHIGLADLLALPGASPLQLDWTARLAARFAGYRAANSGHGGDGAAWITGPAARGVACDAALFPIVTGDPDLGALEDLIKLCVDLDGYLNGHPGDRHHDGGGFDGGGGLDQGGGPDQGTGDGRAAGARRERAEELVREIIDKAAALLSGEAGLASFVRRNLLGDVALGGPSLPLDVGDVDDIPWWIRRAVHTRDQKCRWPGECDQPVAATEPHHVRHRADHGPTAVGNLYDLCWFHHHVLVHQKGWTITARPDGTLEATSPDGRVYTPHTRPPPPRPG